MVPVFNGRIDLDGRFRTIGCPCPTRHSSFEITVNDSRRLKGKCGHSAEQDHGAKHTPFGCISGSSLCAERAEALFGFGAELDETSVEGELYDRSNFVQVCRIAFAQSEVGVATKIVG